MTNWQEARNSFSLLKDYVWFITAVLVCNMAGSSSRIKTRIAYDAAYKLKVINFAEKSNNCEAARKFGVAESNIRLWRKNKAELQEMPESKQCMRGKHSFYPKLEKDLVEWVKNQRKEGFNVTSRQLKLKAKKLSNNNVKYGVSKSFKFSNGWCQRFFKRHSLTYNKPNKLSVSMSTVQ